MQIIFFTLLLLIYFRNQQRFPRRVVCSCRAVWSLSVTLHCTQKSPPTKAEGLPCALLGLEQESREPVSSHCPGNAESFRDCWEWERDGFKVIKTPEPPPFQWFCGPGSQEAAASLDFPSSTYTKKLHFAEGQNCLKTLVDFVFGAHFLVLFQRLSCGLHFTEKNPQALSRHPTTAKVFSNETPNSLCLGCYRTQVLNQKSRFSWERVTTGRETRWEKEILVWRELEVGWLWLQNELCAVESVPLLLGNAF